MNHKDSLKDFESLFLGPKSTNEDEQDCIDVNKANDFEAKQVEKSSTDNSFFEEDRDEIAKDIDPFLGGTNDFDQKNKESILMSKEVSGEFQFIILKSEHETHEEEEKRKAFKRKREMFGKRMESLWLHFRLKAHVLVMHHLVSVYRFKTDFKNINKKDGFMINWNYPTICNIVRMS